MRTKRILFVVVLLSCASSVRASVTKVLPAATGAEFTLSDGALRIDFVTERIVRVRSTRNPAYSAKPSLMRVAVSESPGKIRVSNDPAVAFIGLSSTQLTVRVDRASGAVSYLDTNGQVLVGEDPANPRWLEKTDVIKSLADPTSVTKVKTVDGEREVVGKYTQKKDRDAWKGGLNFRFSDGEALYGLGFDETSDLNLRGATKRLYQHNMRILIPSFVSTRGYGMLFDAYSAMSFKDGPQGGAIAFDVIDDLDYYFILGPDMDGAIRGHRQLTGAATMLPLWGFGYIQSKERYRSQTELIDVVGTFRNRRIPLDVIVQDWNYWLKGQWGGDPDPKYYPDFSALTKQLHAQNARLMISIWPNPSPESTTGKALADADQTLAGTAYFDAFNPAARKTYWASLWQMLGRHGIDAWWCDSTEPEVADWNGRQRASDADEKNIDALAKIIDPQQLNAYALEDSKGIYENSRLSSPDRRVLNLTRSGYAGSQRTGSMLWTGDTSATWDTLAQQVVALQSFSASGNPYITFDIGGFFVRRGSQWFWAGDYNGGVADSGYRELYTRWFQTGAFLPMFRSHGTDTPREPWRFGEPGSPFYDAILDAIHLRYRLLPYFYSLGSEVSLHGGSFLRPVAFGFPADKNTHDLKSQFLVGNAFMVAPVLVPQRFGPKSTPIQGVPESRQVYLPRGASWFDFWTGKATTGGQTVTVDTPIAHTPVFVKAGSIVPMGPRKQFAGEQPNSPIELRVYTGADAAFTLYDDEGDGYGYEKGAYATVAMAWNDRTKTLKIDDRHGKFPGMAEQRTFNVVRVSEYLGVGEQTNGKPTRVIQYTGKAITVPLD